MNPPPPPTLTTHRDSESRGLLKKHIHIPYGLSRFCGVCLPHSHGVDIVAASPTTVLVNARNTRQSPQLGVLILGLTLALSGTFWRGDPVPHPVRRPCLRQLLIVETRLAKVKYLPHT